ncbi:hypothetical protein ACN5L6_003150, partial [Cronobacter dublinensis]
KLKANANAEWGFLAAALWLILNRQCLLFDGGIDGGCAYAYPPYENRFTFCVGRVSAAHPPKEN